MMQRQFTDDHNRSKGILMVLIGATLWGISGTIAQYLFQKEGVSPGWLVSVRLIFSGVLLLIFNSKNNVFNIWKHRKDRYQLIVFAIFGMLMVQYTFFKSIDLGNAATATLLQYLAPIYIVIYIAIKRMKKPTLIELVSVILAILGIFLLVTGGTFTRLSVSTMAIFWGVLSGVALAFYTLYPDALLKKWGTAITIGWGMVIGGVGISFLFPPWDVKSIHWNVITITSILIICLFGTLVAFYLYLSSLNYLQPTETSLLSSAEPLTSTIATIVWLHVTFTSMETLGGVVIIFTVVLLSVKRKETVKELN